MKIAFFVALICVLSCKSRQSDGEFSQVFNEDSRPQWEVDEHPPHLRNPKIDVESYDIDLRIPVMEAVNLPVRLKMRLKLNSDSRDVKLHAHAQSVLVKGVSIGGSAVRFEMIQGKKGGYGLDGTYLKILFDEIKPAGFQTDINIDYEITTALMRSEKGMQFRKKYGGVPIFNTRNWPYYSRFWLPGNDHPYDTATFNFTIHVPKGTYASANGELIEGDYKTGSGELQAGFTTFKWAQKTPIPAYGVNINVGESEIIQKNICFKADNVNNDVLDCQSSDVKTVPYVYYIQKKLENRTEFIAQADKGVKSMVFFSSLLDQYPYHKLGFVTAPQPFNMESVSLMVMVSAEATVHEVAHHWWGNTVYINHWGDFWISEGFTTYFTGLYDQHFDGTNSACTQTTGVLNNHPDTDPLKIFDDTAYCKGSSAIRDLRIKMAKLLGKAEDTPEERDLFYGLMKKLFTTYKFKRLGTDELLVFLKSNLSAAYALSGTNVDSSAVDSLVAKWRSQWFQ